jgi:hypothetical protein
MTEPTDAEIRGLAATGNGVYQDDETAIWEITDPSLMKLVHDALEKWGTPAGAGEPFGYFHQLLNHEGKGNGVWLGAAERKVVEQAHTPGETSEEIVALYTTPQPTQAQAGAVPLDEARRLFDAGWKAAALFCDREDVVADGIIGFGACPQFEAAFSAAHGIKGGQHGTE